MKWHKAASKRPESFGKVLWKANRVKLLAFIAVYWLVTCWFTLAGHSTLPGERQLDPERSHELAPIYAQEK